VTDKPLVAHVVALLQANGVPYAVFGAAALAAHGVARSTFDIDLFTTSTSVLSEAFWSGGLSIAAVSVDIRAGGADDPLRGVVRIEAEGQRSVDVIVGRHIWQGEAVSRAMRLSIAGVDQPVLTAPDLILFKLYAGGPQDCWDIEQLLAGSDGRAIMATVDERLPALPSDARQLWQRLRREVERASTPQI
jgi:hypothetical protein